MKLQAQDLIQNNDSEYDAEAHEEEPKDLPVGISIQGLTKVYDAVSPTIYMYMYIVYAYVLSLLLVGFS